MRSLLASSPAAVRDCLTRQFDRAAGAGELRRSVDGVAQHAPRHHRRRPSSQPPRRRRRSISRIRSAGSISCCTARTICTVGARRAAPDPVLFTVRGWDPTTQRFLYAVNPRFGNTRPSATTLRAPFRLTLDVSVDIGRQIEEQQVDRWLKPGRNGRGGAQGRRAGAEAPVRSERARSVRDGAAADRLAAAVARSGRGAAEGARDVSRADGLGVDVAGRRTSRICPISTTPTRRTDAPRTRSTARGS